MYGIIAAAHGNCASGVYSGLKLVCGEMKNIKVVDFVEGNSAEDLEIKLKKAFDELRADDYEKILFITDLLGGTPFTRSVMNFGEDLNVRVLSGLSLPLLYTASIADDEDIEEGVKNILDEAREGTTCYSSQATEDTDSEDDGI
ncbi:MAG: hypothetical protein KGV57_02355 [Fusobacterium sp.]|nr:hypothetical protein [Fusobacterium sp.]